MPAVWTNSNDEVTRVHYQPDSVDTSDAYIVDTIPDDTSKEWEIRTLYYTEAGGFSEEFTDPMANVSLTDSEKAETVRIVTTGDYSGLIQFLETHF